MKKITFTLLFLFTILNLNAQFSMQSLEEFEKLKQTKTYVVLHDSDEEFNNRIKKAVETNWKLTPYDFIYFKNLNEYSKSEKNSFILVGDFGNTTHPKNAYSFYYNSSIVKLGSESKMKQTMVLSDGEWKSKSSLGSSPVYGSTTLNLQLGGVGKYFNSLPNWLAFTGSGLGNAYVNSSKLTPMIKLLENTANLFLQGKVKKLKVTSGDSYEVYNTNESISTKTLIFLKDEMPYFNKKKEIEFTEEDIKKSYTGKVEIVDEKKLSEKINSNDTQNLYFGSYTEGTFSLVFLYDCTGKIYLLEKMNRMSFNLPESKGWFINALEKFEKLNKK
ncbi:hypothetical protein [Flavobacterium columnare]|uniref:Uncharacterized protein n=2 Tax=Flavobacterium TaxID=237 RepID=A0A2N9PAH6_9FLAO|nr:hypothetical protein [Flavobacterium columnare]RVU92034.1 hypothetical protein EH230_00595 [Flavobacterium columnare]SPE77326.1 hypothetical protein FLACOL_01319 [Flavobacterium columnare]